MRHFLTLIFFLTTYLSASAAAPWHTEVDSVSPGYIPDDAHSKLRNPMAQYPGGQEALMEYLQRNTK